jgi:trigger factor
MQVSIETTEGLERRLTVGIPAERIDKEVNARLQKAAPNVRIDGFRPGKVPMKVIKQRFGAGVRQEVLGEVMSQTFYEAVQQEDLKPAGQPSIEPKTIQEGKDFQYIATFEVYPEVSLASLDDLVVNKAVAEVTDADIDEMIETLCKQSGEWADVEREAADGDQVVMDYVGTKDGEEFEGGKAENSTLELGSNRMIPGFEDGLVGAKAGDERTLELTFPEDYHAEDLKGAAVEFKVTVHSVKEMQPAEVNEELFERFGVTEGGEENFRKELRSNMERELKNAIKGDVKNQVLEALIEKNEVQIPKALVAQEINVLRQQSMQQFGGAAANFDASMLPDELFSEQAERRVKLGLLMGEVIKDRDLKPEADKVREMIEEMASVYEDPEEVVNYYYGNEQQLASVEGAVLEDQVIDALIAEAGVNEESVSYKDAIARRAQ